MNPNNDFLDELAPIVEGDNAALNRHADLLADSEEARDMRYEAERLALRLKDAGGDFEMPQDMAQNLFAALDARDGVSSDVPKPQAPTAADHVPSGAQSAAAHSPDKQPAGAPPASSESGSQAPKKRPWLILWTSVAAVGLAAAAAAALVINNAGDGGLEPMVVGGEDAYVLTATVGMLRHVGEGEGLSLGDGVAARALAEGESIPAGSVVRTDGETRVELALSDGSTLVVDRDTELVVGAAGRNIELRRGQLVAEVAHLDAGPNARFETSAGMVEVLGTKFVLTASSNEASVVVTRGVVRAHGQGESVDVKVGQEGLLRRERTPAVVPATNLAASVAWSELDMARDDAPTPGLGELRAHRPGEREEQERPLSLAHHSVDVRIVGNVARTEIHERFQNDSADELEGVYSFPIPSGARIASLQLKVEGEWQEGAFVSKSRAAAIWRGVIRNATPERQRVQEEFIWVPGPWRDPALLEWQQGGSFDLRIFPITAHGSREIKIAYEQTVEPYGEGRRYVYPLPLDSDASTQVGHFEMNVRVAGASSAKVRGYDMQAAPSDGAETLAMARDRFLPAGDVIIDYEEPDGDAELRSWTFRGDATAPAPERTREDEEVLAAHRDLAADSRGYALFALRPELPGWQEVGARDYVIVVDSSQSMVGERYERAIRLAEGMAREMDRRDRVFALACDVTCRSLDGGPRLPSTASADAIAEFLRKEDPAGASDISAALRSAVVEARRAGVGAERTTHLIYVGDGIASVGPRRAGTLAGEVERGVRAEGVALTTVGIGQDADARVLSAMARAGGGQYVPYVPGQRTIAAALGVLETTYGAALEGASLEFPEGVVAVAPDALPSLRSGQELLVAARLDRDGIAGDVILRGKVGGETFEQRYPVRLTQSESLGNAFVPRLWASKSIEALEDEGRSEDESRIVALSKAYGVMSRSTSLLVLESEEMFRAFGVDRAQPTVQWTGEEDMDYAVSAGSLGLVGQGRGGGGVGSGAMGASATRSAAAPASSAPMAGLDDSMVAEAEPPRSDGAAEPMEERAEAAPTNRRRMARRSRPRGPGRMMRKVWFREGRISRDVNRERDLVAVRTAEERLRQNPNSRDRHRELVRALSRAGELERAEEAAEAWLERDRLDWEALTYLSDAVGRQGDQARALRLLSGVVDLEPNNTVLQQRMANAFVRAGDAERACAHQVAMAEIDPSRTQLTPAVQCNWRAGNEGLAEDLLELGAPEIRRNITRGGSDDAPRVRGDLLASATWQQNVDLDLSIVTPQGTRISWMGGRRNVVGDDGHGRGSERLGLRRAGVGSYHVEISRTDEQNLQQAVSGRVQIEALREKIFADFTIPAGETTAVLGSVRVVRRWRLQ